MTNQTKNPGAMVLVPRDVLESALAAVSSSNTSNWSSRLKENLEVALNTEQPPAVDAHFKLTGEYHADVQALMIEVIQLRLDAIPNTPAVGGELEVEWPEFQDEGMGCGLEDRGITSRYEAMRYGWDEALDRCASEVVAPLLAEIERLKVWAESYAELEKVFHSERDIWNRESSAAAKETGKLQARIAELEAAQGKS